MNMVEQHDEGPWYRQFWLWFVLAPPMASVVLGLSLVFTAVTKGDSMVVDNYSQAGRGLHRSNELERAAVSLGLDGTLVLDRESGQVVIHLQGLEHMPGELRLQLSHPTHAERDVQLLLQRDGSGLYRADARRPVEGRHYLRLQPDDDGWLLARELGQGQDELSLAPQRGSIP